MIVETDTPMANPLVSVVIVNYNSGPYLVESVRTALPQVSEIVVVDNASSDDSLDLCMQHFQDEPKLKILRNHNNRGFAVA